jgi:hypothetical protein
MPPRLYSFLANIGAIAIIAGALLFILLPRLEQSVAAPVTATTTETAAATAPLVTAPPIPFPAATSSTTTVATSSVATIRTAKAPAPAPKKSSVTTTRAPSASTSTTAEAVRIENPYNIPPESFDLVNTAARSALVNILCMPRSGGSLAPISGSGVIIDPRGVILTNAHVAQYVLLSESQDVDLTCQIRTGAPATAQWTVDVLYIPPVWVGAHASEINTAHPTGTGEHDYALLRITGSVPGQSVPSIFPSLPFDTRDAIGFLGDQVLGASYPAEFLGGMAAENNLYPVSSVSPIDQLLTFGTSTVDVISIGGVVEAQSGSSGGGVVNAWGRLIGLISTTSNAPTTAGRDLRAITLSYINRDMVAQTGLDLASYLSGNLSAQEAAFNTTTAPGLIQQYIQVISH